MRNIVIVLFASVIFFSACSEKHEDDKAAMAAKNYYSMLIEGKYAEFIDATVNTGNLPRSYKEQLVTNIKQFASVQKEERGGIKDVKVVSSTYNKKKTAADVLLVLCYKDSASEEVVVPMVEKDGKWLMR
jgi:thioredoxin-related protein